MFKKSHDIKHSNNKHDEKTNSIIRLHKNLQQMKQAAKEITLKVQECLLPPLSQPRYHLYQQYLKNGSRDHNKISLEHKLCHSEIISQRAKNQQKTLIPNKIIESLEKSLKFKQETLSENELERKYCIQTKCRLSLNSQKLTVSQELKNLKLNKSQIRQSHRHHNIFQTLNSNKYQDKQKKNQNDILENMGSNYGTSQKNNFYKIQRNISPRNVDFQIDQTNRLVTKNTTNERLLSSLQLQTLQPMRLDKQSLQNPNNRVIFRQNQSLNPQERKAINKKAQHSMRQKLKELNLQSKSIPKNDSSQLQLLSNDYSFNKQRSFRQYFALMKESIQESIKRRKKIEKIKQMVVKQLPQYAQEKQLLTINQPEQKVVKKKKRHRNHNINANKNENFCNKLWNAQDYTPWENKDNHIIEQIHINQDFNHD